MLYGQIKRREICSEDLSSAEEAKAGIPSFEASLTPRFDLSRGPRAKLAIVLVHEARVEDVVNPDTTAPA